MRLSAEIRKRGRVLSRLVGKEKSELKGRAHRYARDQGWQGVEIVVRPK